MPTEIAHTPASEWCPHPERWSAPDGGAMETEVGNLIAGLVRAVQPGLVVEVGAYLGDTASLIGYALRTNRHGRLISLEPDPERAARARARLRHLPVTVVEASSLDWEPPGPVGVLVLDGDIQLRVAEVERFRPSYVPGTVIVVHDTAPHHREDWELPQLAGGYPFVNLRTPRGVLVAVVGP